MFANHLDAHQRRLTLASEDISPNTDIRKKGRFGRLLKKLNSCTTVTFESAKQHKITFYIAPSSTLKMDFCFCSALCIIVHAQVYCHLRLLFSV
jgi:hypothetical protein